MLKRCCQQAAYFPQHRQPPSLPPRYWQRCRQYFLSSQPREPPRHQLCLQDGNYLQAQRRVHSRKSRKERHNSRSFLPPQSAASDLRRRPESLSSSWYFPHLITSPGRCSSLVSKRLRFAPSSGAPTFSLTNTFLMVVKNIIKSCLKDIFFTYSTS